MSKSKWGPTWTTNLSNKKESHSYKIGSDQSITSRTEEDTVNFCPNCVLLQCRKEDWEQACVHGGSQLLTHHSIGSGRWSSVGSKPACSIQQVPMKHYLEKKKNPPYKHIRRTNTVDCFWKNKSKIYFKN